MAYDISIIRNARLAVSNWTSSLGPVEEWPRVFGEKYDEACCDTVAQSTQAAINEFLKGVIEHVRIGKSILKGIEGCQVVVYPFSTDDKGDRLLASDLMVTLHRGIAILEARLEIHAPAGPRISPLHSDIRRHHEPLEM